jgi:hypothetical protein
MELGVHYCVHKNLPQVSALGQFGCSLRPPTQFPEDLFYGQTNQQQQKMHRFMQSKN